MEVEGSGGVVPLHLAHRPGLVGRQGPEETGRGFLGRLLDQRAKGTATLLLSEDLDEIMALSDRIAVMYEGEIVGVVERDAATGEGLGLMMAGVRPEDGG